MKHKTTAAEVARAAGVGTATVDRVLNGRGGVSADKQRIVIECARKLGLDRNLDYRPSRILRIGVLMQEPGNPFYETLQRTFHRANELYFGQSIQISQWYYSLKKLPEAAQLLEKIAKSIDGLIVVLPDHDATNAALKRVAEKIPVITMASDLAYSGRLAYIGVDNRMAGRTAADLMGRLIGKEGGDIAIVTGLQSFVDQGQREIGFRATLAQRHPLCRVVSVLEARDQAELAGTMVANTLHAFPDIRGIYNLAAGDQEIVRAVQNAKTTERVIIITHELTPDRRRLLKEGALDAVIDQNPEHEAMVAVRAMANHFGRMTKEVGNDSDATRTEIRIFMRENCL